MLKFIVNLFSKRIDSGDSLSEVEKILDYRFRNRLLLQQALTHRSILPETDGSHAQSNETMEFLGDAVIELFVVEYLYRKYPGKDEGELSKLKSMLVSGKALNKVARKLNVGDHILMSKNEARNGGRSRDSILVDSIEALVAALYLDGGRKAARRFVNCHILINLQDIVQHKKDDNYKSQLLEYAQARGLSNPSYHIVNESGPDHSKHFLIEVSLNNEVLGCGRGCSKKTAQQNAACEAISKLLVESSE